MTKKELMQLKDGTLLYNGHTEGEVKTTSNGIKCIEVLIPIATMDNNANYFDDRPEWWDILED